MTAAIAATFAGLGDGDGRVKPLEALTGRIPNTGVIVTTRASGGIRSAAGRAGSQTTCASALIAV